MKVLKAGNDSRNPLPNPLNDSLNELDDEHGTVMPFNALGYTREEGTGSGITESLEELASMGVRKRPRQQSEREDHWINRLVQKHGDNYSAMFRDRKLNPMQQTEGDIQRRIKRWISKQ
jgi:nucleolar protein 16